MADDPRRWMMMGFFAGIDDKPLDAVLEPFEIALKDRIASLQDVAEKLAREADGRQSIYDNLATIYRDEEQQWRSLLRQAEDSTDALEGVRSHGHVSWLFIAIAGASLPVVTWGLRTDSPGIAALTLPISLVLATVVATWRGIALFFPARRLRSVVGLGRTPWLVTAVVTVGAAIVLLSPGPVWPMLGTIAAGFGAGVAVACRWEARRAQVVIVSDLTRAIEQARADSTSRLSERLHSRERLRVSKDGTLQEISSIEAERAQIRKQIALGHHLGSALRTKHK